MESGRATEKLTPEHLLDLCQQVMQSLRGLHWRELLPLRLTMPQVKVLHVLSRREKVTAGELAEILGVSAPTVTNLVGRMVSLGLVHRERGRTDRRVVYVSMTPAGEETLRQVRQEHWSVLRELFGEMSAGDRAALGRGLQALREAVGHYVRRRGEGSPGEVRKGMEGGRRGEHDG